LTRSERLAVSVAFLAYGAAVGNLIPRLPAIKDQLHLSDGEVGVTLALFSLGAVAGAASSRFVLARGSRRYVRGATIALAAAVVLPGLAPDLYLLVASFFLIGVCAGLIDVLVNAQGAELERIAQKPLINSFHGFWSLGAVLGSIVASVAAYLGLAPAVQFAIAGVLIALLSAPFLRDLPDTSSGAERVSPPGASRMWLTGLVFAVATITFAAIIVEAGTSDWSALYLRELSHAEPGVAALGFTGFSLAAMLVRFRADILTAVTSPATVMRIGSTTAALGLILAIAVPALPGALVGFALVGMGCAVQLPLAFAAGANLGRSGTSLAIVFMSAYVGAIVEPALIGFAADRVGLRAAMAIPLAAAIVVLALAGNLAPRSGVEPKPLPAGR
jgi:MFS family permease